MADALFPADAYKAQLLALLPRGRVWPKEAGGTQDATMAGLAPTFERLDARAQSLLVDVFPATTLELLPEWEASLGLPDACDGDDQTISQRVAHVVAKLVNAGGQSVAYFLQVLAGLGYPDASITQYAPFRADVDHADTPLYGLDWAFNWTVNLPSLSIFWFEADVSAADELLWSVSDGSVFCVIDDLRPAHTTVDFTNNP